MSRGDYVKGRGYRTACIVISIGMMVISGVWEPLYSFVLFPVYAFFLFYYLYRATERFSKVFLLFLLSTMVMEVVFLYDYSSYASLVSMLSVASCIFLLLLMKPVIISGSRVFSRHYMVEFIVGFIGVGFVMGYLAYFILPLISDLTIFLPAFIGVLLTASILYSIPLFNKHPANLLLTGVASAILVEMIFAFIYKYIVDLEFFMILAIFFASFFKVIFAMYITRIDGVKNIDENYI